VALPMLISCGSTTTKTVTKAAAAPVTASSSTAAPTTVSTSSSTATVVTTSTAANAVGVYFQGVAGSPRQRPGSLELTGDGTLYVSGVQWTSWGSDAATATGIAHYHGCTPNCAQAPVTNALVAIRLSGIRACAGRRYYSGVTLTLNSGDLLDKAFLQQSWSPC
jgi:hypothetical protein